MTVENRRTTDTVDEIFALFENGGSEAYFGEPVTQLQHALQSAHWAKQAHADDETVLAALLHDIGHLLGGDLHADLGVIDHDRAAVDWLRSRGFSERLIALVAGHVAAKRYLVAVTPGYYDRLSQASKQTLELQGGPMSRDEVCDFESNPWYQDQLRVRTWDELAKDPEAAVAPLEEYRWMLAAHLGGV